MRKRMITMLAVVLLASGCAVDTPPPDTQPSTQATTAPTTAPTTEPTTIPATQPILTGWQELDGQRYYFDENGEPWFGWLTTEEGTWYLNADGSVRTGWADIGAYTYYFRADGSMQTGWLEEGGNRYYFQETGALTQGWSEIDGKLYEFGPDGAARTGWTWRDGNAYYLQSDGSAAVGPTEIDGQTCYFSPHGIHVLLVNAWNYLPEGYEPNLEDTVWGMEVDASCREALEQMYADCRKAGFDPAICSAYRTQGDQEYLYERNVRRYLNWGYSQEEAEREAAKSVAIPGTSEHQLGLAVDIVDNSNWSLTEVQEQMPTQQWLMEHCWEYGFILRYPNGTTDITGIIYEPWHYRYVGVEIALELRDLGITLEEYLGFEPPEE